MENNVERLLVQAKEKDLFRTDKPVAFDYLVHECANDGFSKGEKKIGVIKKIKGNTAVIVENGTVEKGISLNSPLVVGFISAKMFDEPRKKTKE